MANPARVILHVDDVALSAALSHALIGTPPAEASA